MNIELEVKRKTTTLKAANKGNKPNLYGLGATSKHMEIQKRLSWAYFIYTIADMLHGEISVIEWRLIIRFINYSMNDILPSSVNN